MTEPSPQNIHQSISALTTRLVEEGLVDDQEWPAITHQGPVSVVTTQNPVNAAVLKAVPYEDLYADQLRRRAFNFVLLDRALVQMSYEFKDGHLQKHRLAFLPSPNLIDFQTDPALYLHEVPYVEVVGTQVMPMPIRFDFDVRATVNVGVGHPAAHLTLGQYKHCRIPVTAPVTPGVFVDFIIRHFYRTPDMPEVSLNRELEVAFALSDPEVDGDAVHLVSPGRR